MLCYEILPELRFNLYHQVLEFASRVPCKYGSLVVPEDQNHDEYLVEFLEELTPFVTEIEENQLHWPGNPDRGNTPLPGQIRATVFYFTINSDSLVLLNGHVHRLYDWIGPSYPEDFCLLREDRSAWLESVSHERMAFLNLTQAEADALLDAIPELRSLIRLIVPPENIVGRKNRG